MLRTSSKAKASALETQKQQKTYRAEEIETVDEFAAQKNGNKNVDEANRAEAII